MTEAISYQELVLKSMLFKVEERLSEALRVIAEARAEVDDLREQEVALREALSDMAYRRESVGIATAPQVWH